MPFENFINLNLTDPDADEDVDRDLVHIEVSDDPTAVIELHLHTTGIKTTLNLTEEELEVLADQLTRMVRIYGMAERETAVNAGDVFYPSDPMPEDFDLDTVTIP